MKKEKNVVGKILICLGLLNLTTMIVVAAFYCNGTDAGIGVSMLMLSLWLIGIGLYLWGEE